MSVTRNINANTSTQVNSDKVGVLVVPEAGSIKGSYNYNQITIVNKIDNKDVITDHDENVYKYNGDTKTVGETTYYKVVPVDDESLPIYYNQYEEPLQSQTLFTITGEEGEEVVTPATTVGSVFSVSGNGIQVEEDKVKVSDTTYKIEGDYIRTIAQQSFIVGKISATTAIESNVSYAKQNTSTWTGKVEWLGSGHTVWSDSDRLAVGDKLYFSKDTPAYNQQTVTEVTPVSISCTLSYSVDGSTWTNHSTTLTDANNVICSIPKYMYIKFTQDVVITEE